MVTYLNTAVVKHSEIVWIVVTGRARTGAVRIHTTFHRYQDVGQLQLSLGSLYDIFFVL